MTNQTPDNSHKRTVIVHSAKLDAARLSLDTIERAQALIHEVANLVDGSLRLIDLARRAVRHPEVPESEPGATLRHLDGAHAAMAHIGSLVRSVYQPAASPARATRDSLTSAIVSATDLLLPRLRERDIELHLDLDPALQGVPADEAYAVVSNAVRNSMEAIGERGRIDVRGRLCGREVRLEILDDGAGPPHHPERVFELGFTTKTGSSGIGLSLAAEVIGELGGRIELTPRNLNAPHRPGAALIVTFPVPNAASEHFLG